MRAPPRPPVSAAAAVLLLLACGRERPPAPETAPGPAEEPSAAKVRATYDPRTPAVLTYAAERGRFADTHDPSAVPEASRGLVRVTLLDGKVPPPGMVWVTNLRKPAEDGTYPLEPVPRELFEELALGQGLSSAVELPEGLEPPDLGPPQGGIVVYKTSWCGVCKKLEAYLRRKGVEYVAKDIEADRAAAAELKAKLDAVGAKGGSVPVVDVGGEIVVGFDRARLERLLADVPKEPPEPAPVARPEPGR